MTSLKYVVRDCKRKLAREVCQLDEFENIRADHKDSADLLPIKYIDYTKLNGQDLIDFTTILNEITYEDEQMFEEQMEAKFSGDKKLRLDELGDYNYKLHDNDKVALAWCFDRKENFVLGSDDRRIIDVGQRMGIKDYVCSVKIVMHHKNISPAQAKMILVKKGQNPIQSGRYPKHSIKLCK